MKKHLYLLLVPFLAGCSSEIEGTIDEDSTIVNSIHVSVLEPTSEGDEIEETRLVSSYSTSTKLVEFSYEVGDQIGIFPTEGSPIAFTSGESGPSVTIDAGAWQTKAGYTYATYYPYSYLNQDKSAVPFSYLGQVQDGDNNAAHLSSSMLLAAGKATPKNGSFNVKLSKVGAVLRLGIKLPNNCNVTKIVLNSKSSVFVTSGKVDLFGDNFPIKDGKKASDVTLNFKSPVAATSTSTMVAYLNVSAPLSIPANDLTIKVYDNAGNVYSQVRTTSATVSQNATYSMAFTSLTKSTDNSLGTLTGVIE